MSDQLTVGELVYKISGDMDNLKTELKKAESQIGQLEKSMNSASASTDGMAKRLTGAATAVKAFIAGFAIKQVLDFAQSAVEGASAQFEQQTRLYNLLRTSRNASDEQIKGLLDQASALEQVGVVSKEVTIAAQAQFATFDLSADAIKRLTPAFLDYLTAEKGVTASQEDAKSMATALAQALQGNYAALSKSGFILDEATKKTIEFGNETERTQAIVEVLNSTYENYNEALGKTFLGTQVRAQRIIGDFKDDLGFALMPAIQSISEAFIGMATELAGTSEQFQAGEGRINAWGKTLYQGAQFVIGAGVILKGLAQDVFNLGKILIAGGKVVFAFFQDFGDGASAVGKKWFNFASATISNAGAISKGIVKAANPILTAIGAIFKAIGKPIDFTPLKEGFDSMVNEVKGQLVQMVDSEVNEKLPKTVEAMKELGDAWSDVAWKTGDAVKEAQAYFDKGNSGEGFKPVTAEALKAWDAMNKVGEAGGNAAAGTKKAKDAAEEAAKKLEQFQQKLLGIIDSSKKTQESLGQDLVKAFKGFGDGITENIDATVTSLAQIVVGAEQKIKDLNGSIADEQKELNDKLVKERADLAEKIMFMTDKDADISIAKARKDSNEKQAEWQAESDARLATLRDQIAKEEEILKTREGFEERQAARIEEIRTKLNAAGIDTAASGLDNVLNSKSLQDQIDEERRRSSLNEFQIFEEDQTKKLQILSDNFIAEVTILRDKVAKQKEFEAELTSYLINEDASRLASTDSWAQATIAKYGEVANSLENLISLKAQLGEVSASVAPPTPTSVNGDGSSSSNSVSNTKNINAPVTINAGGANSVIDYRAISREMGFEINRM